MINIFYFFFIEFWQMYKKPEDYFDSVYNFADLISYSLCFFVVILYIS